MPYTNTHRMARVSPQKARLVVDLIRGKDYADALTTLELSKLRAAVLVKNALVAAYHNADQDEADTRRLRVTEARVDAGPTIKRFQPKDRGRAHPILKRTSHITISVDETQPVTD
ncbi:MAG: 50S ribosomal protein L22 [Planctomycetota bacterium]